MEPEIRQCLGLRKPNYDKGVGGQPLLLRTRVHLRYILSIAIDPANIDQLRGNEERRVGLMKVDPEGAKELEERLEALLFSSSKRSDTIMFLFVSTMFALSIGTIAEYLLFRLDVDTNITTTVSPAGRFSRTIRT